MALWNTIPAARYADETLFAADLPLDIMGRDFGQTVVCDPSIGMGTGSTFEAWTAIHDLWIAFPESWGVDLTFPAKLRVSLPVKVQLTGIEYLDVDVFKVRLTSTGEEITCPTGTLTPSVVTVTVDYTSSIPTGVTSLDLEYYLSPTGTSAGCAVSRTRGDYGPNAWIGFVQP